MSLLSRVAKLEGADREVDFAIHEHFYPTPNSRISDVKLPPGFGADALSRGLDPRPVYTGSIDAAVSLVKRVRPGWEWDVGSIHQDFRSVGEPRFIASISSPITWVPPMPEEGGMDEPCSDTFEGRSESPAIALILALLHSLNTEPVDA